MAVALHGQPHVLGRTPQRVCDALAGTFAEAHGTRAIGPCLRQGAGRGALPGCACDAAGQRVAGAGNADQGRAHQRVKAELGRGRYRAQFGNEEVDVLLLQAGRQLGRCVLLDLHLHARKALPNLRQQLRQHLQGDHRSHAKAQHAGFAVNLLRQRLFKLLGLLQQRTCTRQQGFAQGIGQHLRTTPVEQRCAQLFFQRLNAAAEGRLAQVGACGGPRELLFVGQQGKFTSIDQLKGKKVGVQNGTTHQKFITDKHPEITTVPYDSYQNAKLDLQNGRIDAVFGDTAVVTEWLKSNPKLAAVGDKVTDKAYFGTGLGIAVRQGNTDLQQKFNAALEKVKKDGTYQTIYNKWFQK